MASLPVALSPRMMTLLKRGAIVFVLTAFLVYLIPAERMQSMWMSRAGWQLAQQYKEGSDQEYHVRDWGMKAKDVARMTGWAKELMEKHPSLDGRELTTALMERYPYLAGNRNLYIPWDRQRAQTYKDTPMTGLVMCVGSGNYHLAAHLIVSLRNVHQSSIPIEVAYAGDEDLKPEHRQFLEQLASDVTMLDLLRFFPNAKHHLEKSGWAMKPFSLLASRSRHTILVDADALFLISPDRIFEEHPGLIETGTLLYHDRAAQGEGDKGLVFLQDQIRASGHKASEYLTEHSLYYKQESWYEADSGVVAMDKTRPEVFMGMVFVTWMNTKEVRDQVAYKLYYGDKETFWIAMELAGVKYFFNPWYAGTLGKAKDGLPANPVEQKTQICGTHMLHMDHTGEKPFWINGGIYQHKGKKERGYASLTHWWRGNQNVEGKPRWWWEEGNVACLSEPGVKDMTPEQMTTVTDMISAARQVDEKIEANNASSG